MISARCMKGPIEYRDSPPEWLALIWACNDIDPEMFGEPTEISEWWAGGTVEEYEHARVIHRTDPTVSIVSKTDYGAAILRGSAVKLGIQTHPLVTYMKLEPKEEA